MESSLNELRNEPKIIKNGVLSKLHHKHNFLLNPIALLSLSPPSLSLSLTHTHTSCTKSHSILYMVLERLVNCSKPILACCAYADVHEEPVDPCSSNPAQFVSQRRRNHKSTNMNMQMGNTLPTEKLNRNYFAPWEYKMHQYLICQGY